MSLHSCPCCGLIQHTRDLTAEVCHRCETVFQASFVGDRRNRLTLALSLAAIVLYVPAVTWKFLRIEQLGQRHESSLLRGVFSLFNEQQYLVGVIVLLFSIILPMVKLSALVFLCQPQWRMQPRHLATTYRLVEHLGRWGMLDVLLVAVMVAFIKLGGLVAFGEGPGLVLFALFVLMSLSASLAFNPQALWAESADDTGSAPPPPSPTAADPIVSKDPPFSNAKPRPPRGTWSMWGVWLFPLVTLLGVGGLSVREWWNQPRQIEITFQEGHGIKAGDELKYHGVVVGEVSQIRFAESLQELVVHVALTSDGNRLAREGSRFWIVRPQFDLTGIEGLDTVVGANYLAVQPAAPTQPVAARFRGLEEPPLPDLDFPGGIEVILESLDAQGLAAGTAVYYRRLRIGGVISSGLNLNQSRVEARVYIRPEYRHLIRTGTVFWNMSGVRFQGGLTELSVHIGPVESVLQGGIGVAVPADPGDAVQDGYRYRLAPKAENEWFEWQPELGSAPVPPPVQLPTLTPAKLEWTHDGIFSNSARARIGWALALGTQIHAPADLLQVPTDEITGSAKLTVGEEVFDEEALQHSSDLASGLISKQPPLNANALVRSLSIAEDCFLVTGNEQPPVFVAAGLLHQEGAEWGLDPELPLTTLHHGGVLVAHKDAALLGQVRIEGRRFFVQPLVH